ncbi:DNA polymerase III subunit epsilon [Methylobacterium sp. Leaf104]|uniref:3'-5' exonuclease n=1 Tax=Methylobacterium TaxID=407 RepID=UPI0006F53C65|nr:MULTISPECIES: 3'-5' exonuclease [Methylobacterium]KQP31257.1 DNA polymerase III subunit epsilon [Methylobacterium sp. Leaf104]MCI9881360.1 3'-5' exonuclease [Methylobacterium goesingense]
MHALDAIAAALETTGAYRVLRQIEPLADAGARPDEPTFIGLIVDTETTGLDHTRDTVIELGMIKFEYGASGRVYRVLATLNQLHDPGRPIPAEITRLTGISDSDVAGQRIDDAAVAAMAADAAVVIAHNASFDRLMCEARWPVFADKNWACSCHQVPWRAEGHEGSKLGYLLIDHGYFHKGHRAIDDCHALLALLAVPLRNSGRLALSCLLETARRPTVRVWAAGSPIATKDVLKGRSYRWSGRRRCWYIDIEEDRLDLERAFLCREIYQREIHDLVADRITARDRFSIRTNPDA